MWECEGKSSILREHYCCTVDGEEICADALLDEGSDDADRCFCEAQEPVANKENFL